MRFVLQPHFYQTNWFRALCAAMFLAVLWAAYQFRVHHLQKESKQLRDVIDTIPAPSGALCRTAPSISSIGVGWSSAESPWRGDLAGLGKRPFTLRTGPVF